MPTRTKSAPPALTRAQVFRGNLTSLRNFAERLAHASAGQHDQRAVTYFSAVADRVAERAAEVRR